MRLFKIEMLPSPLAFLVGDDGDCVAVPLAVKQEEMLANVVERIDLPEVNALSDEEQAQLQRYRDAYALTPHKYYEGPDGRAKEQISLQVAMAPLVARERRMQLVASITAVAKAPPAAAEDVTALRAQLEAANAAATKYAAEAAQLADDLKVAKAAAAAASSPATGA